MKRRPVIITTIIIIFIISSQAVEDGSFSSSVVDDLLYVLYVEQCKFPGCTKLRNILRPSLEVLSVRETRQLAK